MQTDRSLKSMCSGLIIKSFAILARFQLTIKSYRHKQAASLEIKNGNKILKPEKSLEPRPQLPQDVPSTNSIQIK